MAKGAPKSAAARAASTPAEAPVFPPVPGQVPETVLERMRTLSRRPPQSLVIEGGSEALREDAALAWAALLNCTAAVRPCGICPACVQVSQRVFLDLKLFGLTEKLLVEDVRTALPEWGQPPRGLGQRVSIFFSAHEFHPSVANLLLKTLEEPRPGNVFVLLAPQRERLLQTLVSRSFVLTLPWPEAAPPEPDVAEWMASLLEFLDTGQGWFERTGTKGSVDRSLAVRLVAGLQRELARALLAAAPGAENVSEQARRLARFGPARLRRFDLVLAAAQEALSQPTVMPALVLDWLATSMIAKKPRPAEPRRG